MVMRVTLERWKAVMLGRLENKVTTRLPKPLTEEGLRGHAEAAFSHRDLASESLDVFETELARGSTDRECGEVMQLLKTFPSKQVVGVVSSCLGQSVGQPFELMSRALLAADGSPLFSLGQCLEAAFTTLGLPVRQAELRITEPASP